MIQNDRSDQDQKIVEIKICGLRRPEDIRMINSWPVDYAGFVFAKSKRQVTRELAADLISRLRSDICPVGVFVNEKAEEINLIAGFCGLKIVQLHGDESAEICRNINGSVWKAFRVRDRFINKEIESYRNAAEAILLDAYSRNDYGGTGKTFHWDMIKGLSEKYPLILAGGITPDNIEKAVQTVRPKVIDVSSGVEKNGKKNAELIGSLMRRVMK